MKHDYYIRTTYETRDSKSVSLIDRETNYCVAVYRIGYANHTFELAYCTKAGRSKFRAFESFDDMIDFISRNYDSMRFAYVDRH